MYRHKSMLYSSKEPSEGYGFYSLLFAKQNKADKKALKAAQKAACRNVGSSGRLPAALQGEHIWAGGDGLLFHWIKILVEI